MKELWIVSTLLGMSLSLWYCLSDSNRTNTKLIPYLSGATMAFMAMTLMLNNYELVEMPRYAYRVTPIYQNYDENESDDEDIDSEDSDYTEP